ncbi:MAG TPA: DNA adenine methylase [Chitinophagales bacterium]|nr:DNA adenine methylase [Chitinophagales bacterium]
MIKSPLRYPGGKSRVVEQIASLIPAFDEYREPFVGGGSVFLYLKQKYPNKTYWVNDLYDDLYKFWVACQVDVGQVVEQVLQWKTIYQTGKELHRFLTENMPNFNDMEKASAFFVFNRITFSGTTQAGGYSEQAFKGRFTQSSIDRLMPFSRLLNNTRITNVDYSEVLTQPGNNVFVFLDPPYFAATKSALYGKNGKLHKVFDHEKFAGLLKDCPHKWLITYDDSPYIRDLFAFAHINTWSLTYGMRNVTPNSSQKGEELFIANYPVYSIPKLELRLFAEPNQPYLKNKNTSD